MRYLRKFFLLICISCGEHKAINTVRQFACKIPKASRMNTCNQNKQIIHYLRFPSHKIKIANGLARKFALEIFLAQVPNPAHLRVTDFGV